MIKKYFHNDTIFKRILKKKKDKELKLKFLKLKKLTWTSNESL